MTGSHDEERYRHDVTPWTIGQLRAAMADLPDDTPIEVAVAEQAGGAFVNLWVVINAAANHDKDSRSEFTIPCEYPGGTYVRPRTARRGPVLHWPQVLAPRRNDGRPPHPLRPVRVVDFYRPEFNRAIEVPDIAGVQMVGLRGSCWGVVDQVRARPLAPRMVSSCLVVGSTWQRRRTRRPEAVRAPRSLYEC
jgi:hypothetical protein